MKYIDAEKLIALIDSKLEELGMSGSVWVGRSVLRDLKTDIITSLQQERQEVDFEKEIKEQWKKWDDIITYRAFLSIARYFYKLGLNAIKED